MANKKMWDWLDEVEGNPKGTSIKALNKEKIRQGYLKKKIKSKGRKK